MKFLIAFLALLVVAQAAIITPQPPAPCTFFAMSSTGLTSIANWLPNVMFYNANDLMSGSPVGPYFSLDAGTDCWLNLNTSNSGLRCNISLYADSARSQRIGSGLLQSTSLQIGAVQNGFQLIGGYVSLSTSITNPPATLPQPSVNFLSRSSVPIYFEYKQVVPGSGNGPAVANGIRYSDSNHGQFTLWGSNGWDAASSSYSGARTTGLDFQASLVCAPFAPPPTTGRPTNPGVCVCEDAAAHFTASTSELAAGGTIRHTAAGTCARLTFSS